MKKPHAALAAFLAALLVTGAAALLACDEGNAVKESVTPKDTGIGPRLDAGPSTNGGMSADGAPSDCFVDPKTHFEIINACTDAVRIAKTPTLPLLTPDGGLPPLQ